MDELTSGILQQLLEKTDDQTATLARIDANLTTHLKAYESHVTEHKEVEKRVTKIEDSQKKVKWMALGAGGVVALAWRVVEAVFWGGPHQ